MTVILGGGGGGGRGGYITKIIIILKTFSPFFSSAGIYTPELAIFSNYRSIECFILKIQQVLYMRSQHLHEIMKEKNKMASNSCQCVAL